MIKKVKINKNFIILITCLLIGVVSVILRMPKLESQNYKNADATWHTMLTIQAYDETPANQHYFLPIVSLGEQADKNISWGGAIPDELGNYYYTSFSSLGFFVPYLFNKVFKLPNNEQSIYLFNSILYLISFLLLAIIMCKLFKNNLPKNLIIIVSTLYLFQTEVMHSQGIAYWHQSLFQVLFLLQLLCFIDLKKPSKKIVFFILCLILPFLEWTGYISNFAYFIVFVYLGYKSYKYKNKVEVKQFVINFCAVALTTLAALVCFIGQFLLVTDLNSVIQMLIKRFNSRSFDGEGATVAALIAGYWQSFKFVIIALVIVLGISIIYKNSFSQIKNIIKGKGEVLFILIFTMLENFIMLEHAISYTFDRLKLVNLIIFLLVLFITAFYNSIKQQKFKNYLNAGCISVIILLNLISFTHYYNDNVLYKNDLQYLGNNKIIAQEINKNYNTDNSIIIQNFAVRGYTNLLFGRGVYEFIDVNTAKEIAKEKNIEYIIELHLNDAPSNLYEYYNYTVHPV